MLNPVNNPPCHDCDERRAGCHDRCAVYQAWHIKQAKIKRDLTEANRPVRKRYTIYGEEWRK